MIVNDHNNSGTPQLYMRTDKGFESIDNFVNKEQISSIHQETSVVYTFCVNKLQVILSYIVNCVLYNIINFQFKGIHQNILNS